MKFSIITPSYEQGRYIRQNIESVLTQGWREVQHIVVDGGSADETVDILKTYPHLEWVSEKDEGQADALSKGLRLATGDIIGWVNSDDYYLDGAFAAIAEAFSDPAVQWVIGDVSIFDEGASELIPSKSAEVSWESLQGNPDIVRQQGTFFRREFLLEAGGWNKDFYMVMDFDLWVRLAKRSRPRMLDRQLAVFRIQKDQKTGLANLRRQTTELTRVLVREGASSRNVRNLRIRKEWHWLKGTIKSFLVRLGLLDKQYLLRPLRGWRGS
jgi:glycosyltransferase involved in cell wall biosynthesis